MEAWLRKEVVAPIPSSADWSLRANASIGTFLDTGKIATVFKFVLLWPSSEVEFLACAVVEESTSSLTREAIIRRSL